MSSILTIPHPDEINDANVFAFILNDSNEFLIVSSLTFEEYNELNENDYKLYFSEISDTGLYSVNFPLVVAGIYDVIVKDEDRSPQTIGCGTVEWDGINITSILIKNAIIDPLAPGLSTGYCMCLSKSGIPEEDVQIFYREATAVSDGYSYSDEYGMFKSNQSGIAQFNGFIQGAQYRIWRGQLDWEEDKGVLITVPLADNFELPKHLGSP